jgi:hypothetical protein
MIRIDPLYTPQIEALIDQYFKKLDQQLGCKSKIDPELAKKFAEALEKQTKERKDDSKGSND